jgi:pre-mRNA-splicing factor SYF2
MTKVKNLSREKPTQDNQEILSGEDLGQDNNQQEPRNVPSESTKGSASIARAERLKKLKARTAESLKANRKEVYEEHKRSQVDEKEQARLQRKREQAEFELAKLESKESDKDFERQRAWDWTVEEAERWDEKEKQKKDSVNQSAFSDYASSAMKAYEKDMKNFKVDLDEYKTKKEKGVIKVNDDLTFVNQRPSKQAVERLVDGLKSGDERRMKRRKNNDEDEHVSYINEKNKHFNQKVARHYDKYTKELRDNFERGTAL